MVEDYLSDREQEEALRRWWQENWRWILGGIALGLALLAAWYYWQHYKTQQAHQASAMFAEYQAAGADEAAAQSALDRLIAEHPKSAYTAHARLDQAKKHVDAQRYDEAAAQLRAVADTSKDDELAWIARLRLARVLIQQGKHDEVLSLLKPEKAGAFAARVREVRGDALFAKGDTEGARAEYAAALAANPDAQTDRQLLEMKLQQVGEGAQSSAPTAAAAVE